MSQTTVNYVLALHMLCTVNSGSVLAQAADRKVHGYTYVGISFPSPEGVGLGIIGGGMEALVHERWGAGGEFGYITSPAPTWTNGGFHLSPTLLYHFFVANKDSSHFFIVGGPALFILPGRTTGGVTIGIGLQRWVNKHIGFRCEIRESYLPKEEYDPYNSGRISGDNLGFRFGLSFR